jgi:hypothetical protein
VSRDPRPLSPASPAGGSLEILPTSRNAEWREVLEATEGHDFCHLPEYHRVSEHYGEGRAHLFVWREAGCTIAFPLLIRPINPSTPDGWKDATSVYGYGGPVASPGAVPPAVSRHFQEAVQNALGQMGVVSAFSRLHPLLNQHALLEGLGEMRLRGQTVSIDLTQTEEAQWAGYHKKCRNSIRKLQLAGYVGYHDRAMKYLPQFVEVYHETMRRVGAQRAYFFDLEYFQTLAREMGPALHLFVVLRGEDVASATLGTLAGGIMQDFLGGSRDAFLKLSPDRLAVDTERRCARELGAKVLHLGGGVGLQEDSVFQYKARFSDRRHSFSTWQCILLPEVYTELCQSRARSNEAQGLRALHPDYFPAYRCPTVPAAN